MNIINPKDIKTGFPYVVFASDSNNLISWLIRKRTNGVYNHVMFLYREGYYASQDGTFQEVPIEKYFKKTSRLKIYALKASEEDKSVLISLLMGRLKQKWYKRRYDFLGIFGQLTGLRWINNPMMFYCSEQVASDLSKAMTHIAGKPTPEELNDILKSRPDEYEYIGHWLGD